MVRAQLECDRLGSGPPVVVRELQQRGAGVEALLRLIWALRIMFHGGWVDVALTIEDGDDPILGLRRSSRADEE
jgi:hypothetical protein